MHLSKETFLKYACRLDVCVTALNLLLSTGDEAYTNFYNRTSRNLRFSSLESPRNINLVLLHVLFSLIPQKYKTLISAFEINKLNKAIKSQ